MLPAYLIMIWRNASAARSLIVVFMLVGEGDRIATAQNSAMAIAAELMPCVIFVFIRLLAICWFYLFLRNFLHSVAKKFENPLGPSTHNTGRARGGTRQTLERKTGENKAASKHWLRCLTPVI